MLRTVISIEPADNKWLNKVAKHEHVSKAAIIRQAIQNYRKEVEVKSKPGFKELHAATRGLWRKGNALAYQRKIRSEWEK
jgi:hypothetical protein